MRETLYPHGGFSSVMKFMEKGEQIHGNGKNVAARLKLKLWNVATVVVYMSWHFFELMLCNGHCGNSCLVL